MFAVWLNVSSFGPTLLASSAIIAAALVARLSNVTQATRGQVCRAGLHPVRVEVGPARATTVISERTMDQDHVWIRTAAVAQIRGDETG